MLCSSSLNEPPIFLQMSSYGTYARGAGRGRHCSLPCHRYDRFIGSARNRFGGTAGAANHNLVACDQTTRRHGAARDPFEHCAVREIGKLIPFAMNGGEADATN